MSQVFNAGLTLLDGSKSRDDWVEGECGGLVPYEKRPQLLRTDWVQNSNDSYWATNPDAFLTGFSPLFGSEETPLNPRTRIGIKMLQNPSDPGFAAGAPAGQDGKFGAIDLINVIYNNRTWYAEEFLPELRDRCTLIGNDPVNLSGGGSRAVDEACDVLQDWNGVYDVDSVGAFNAIGVVASPVAEDTVFPRIAPSTIGNTAGLSDQPGEGWLMARGTSWHFGLEFTDEGPQAYGLVSYSQSSDEGSPYFNDQGLRYSEKDYRKLYFSDGEIEANLIPNGTIQIMTE